MRSTPGRAWPIHPLLFAAYAVLFLFAQNVAEVGLHDAVPPLGRSVIGAGLALAICGLLYRDLRRGALVATALVAAFFGYGHVAKLLGEDPSREVMLAGWGILILVVVLLAWKLPAKRIASITIALDVIAAALVVFSLVQIVPTEMDAIAAASAPLPDRPAPHPGDPDIYFIIFDRYGNEDSLKLLSGVDNDLPAYLESKGFQVAHDARANYGRTALSIASTFHLDYLDDLIAKVGAQSTDMAPLNEMLQDHEVGRTLRERGYKLYQLGSWFTPTSTSRIADEVIQPGRETDFEVLLRDTTMLPVVDDLVVKPEIVHSDLQHREFGLFQFRELERIRSDPGPKFVFAHILLPHPPYVFDADGSYPTAAERSQPDPVRLVPQLTYTNTRIRELVDQLLDAPEGKQPIVILAADEGPYPPGYGGDHGTFDWATASDEALRIKYGILDAFHFPAGMDQPIPEEMSPVNTFRLVFDRAFGMDLPLLPDRSYTSVDWPHAYDLTDVTARLDASLGMTPEATATPDASVAPGASPAPVASPGG
ncbi:MAG: hypothetical protein U0869_01750 [Chloroflexota bacterium]